MTIVKDKNMQTDPSVRRRIETNDRNVITANRIWIRTNERYRIRASNKDRLGANERYRITVSNKDRIGANERDRILSS